ncbi:SoxR reducing system RseC family protein [Candidatus Dependentiae bacterium]|nr:SoxR reducing system RseC family protein [Candidatus Dependentiae bacterium]
MIEYGIITNIEDDLMKIEIKRSSACIKCGLCSADLEKKNFLFYPKLPGFQKGDQIKIKIPENVILKSSFIIFFIPVLGILLGIFSSLLLKDFLSLDFNLLLIISICIFLVVSFLLIRLFDKKSDIKKRIKLERIET